MKQTLFSILPLAIALSGSNAFAAKLVFECAIKPLQIDGVRVSTTDEFNDLKIAGLAAQVEIIKNGKVITMGTNAQIVERTPVTADKTQPHFSSWALNADLGRSGSLAMGFDPVENRWYVNSKTLGLQAKDADADCRVVGDNSILK